MGRSQLLKGTTTLLVLAVLREGELYGYEIAARIRERSAALIDPGEGWLYPALHRLEAAGALEASSAATASASTTGGRSSPGPPPPRTA